MSEETIKIRSPKDFMDCLTILRKDGCMACSYRPLRIGNWEGCPRRQALKDNN